MVEIIDRKSGKKRHPGLVIATILVAFVLFGCGQNDKTKILEQYKYEENVAVPDKLVRNKVGSWVKEGITCYGIVVVHDENNKPLRVKEVCAKVVSVEPDKVRMRSLEDIMMAQVKGCTKYSIKKGEDWDEIEGDIFKTREEAIELINTKYPGLRMK